MPGRIVPLSGGVCDRAVVVDEQHVHAAELLDAAALGRVEEDHLVAAVLDRLGLREQARRVVAAALGRAGAAGGGARCNRRTARRSPACRRP